MARYVNESLTLVLEFSTTVQALPVLALLCRT